ncbi:hypothetical protein PAP_00990 [Palaeococcus pacificus DY20341]|uniref:Sulfur carrier protein ThiS n=1 Tax=Palaeococcus pacificus DY20341 TaxID=1343739 RepID=A0A075LPP6_9EURY|nr:MoaD/ThiS family protein [Palaeococcus pacificus]AIF68640.1 hypothetical protein PAP_00990 [Palaeococcus pacificus DY20341]
MRVKIKLYGDLALNHSPEFELEVREGSDVKELLRELKISVEEHHILVNERKVDESYKLKDGDVLKLLPVVYGG